LGVWWDEKLQTGQKWEASIDEALRTASVVLVLWSKESVKSEWVKQEASYAKVTENLVQARIDDCSIPSQFASLQAADLRSWNKRENASEFVDIVAEINRIRESVSDQTQSLPAATAPPSDIKGMTGKYVLFATILGLVVGFAAGRASYRTDVVSPAADTGTGPVSTSAARDTTGEIVPGLVFEDLTQQTNVLDYRVVSGRIRNTGSGTFKKINVAVEWSDEKGTVLESGSETVLYDTLRAGAARSFSVTVKDDPRLSSFRLHVVEFEFE